MIGAVLFPFVTVFLLCVCRFRNRKINRTMHTRIWPRYILHLYCFIGVSSWGSANTKLKLEIYLQHLYKNQLTYQILWKFYWFQNFMVIVVAAAVIVLFGLNLCLRHIVGGYCWFHQRSYRTVSFENYRNYPTATMWWWKKFTYSYDDDSGNQNGHKHRRTIFTP